MSDPPSASTAPPADTSAADAVEKNPAGPDDAVASEPGSESNTPSGGEGSEAHSAATTAQATSSSADGGYRVTLPEFEGPLDLLIHLIEEHELDIRDIPIAFVAEKYVEYITLMEELNIDVASEYLVMAATLAYIKSRSLLPSPPAEETDEDEVEVDPRAELIRRLLEYQKYKHVAERLAEKDLLGRDVFPRGMKAPDVDGPAPLAGMSLFKLLDAFQSVLSRATLKVEHQIDFERFSISDRINEISDILRSRPRLAFDDLFEGQRTRAELIVTFLALLEMTRLRLIRLFQEGPLEPIYIELAVSEVDKSDANDELSRPSSAGLEPDDPNEPMEPEEPRTSLPESDDEEDDFGEEEPFEGQRYDGERDADGFDADGWPEGETEFGQELEERGELGDEDADELEPGPSSDDEDDAPEREPR